MPHSAAKPFNGTAKDLIMKILLNSDKQVDVSPELSRFVKAEIKSAFGMFEDRLTRVEIHLSDLNSHKPGVRDKRCQLEARPAQRKPVSVSEKATTVKKAVRGAASKMKRRLKTSFGRVRDVRMQRARAA
jgi:ribosome-associated translation inhibitor RaiA